MTGLLFSFIQTILVLTGLVIICLNLAKLEIIKAITYVCVIMLLC